MMLLVLPRAPTSRPLDPRDRPRLVTSPGAYLALGHTRRQRRPTGSPDPGGWNASARCDRTGRAGQAPRAAMTDPPASRTQDADVGYTERRRSQKPAADVRALARSKGAATAR